MFSNYCRAASLVEYPRRLYDPGATPTGICLPKVPAIDYLELALSSRLATRRKCAVERLRLSANRRNLNGSINLVTGARGRGLTAREGYHNERVRNADHGHDATCVREGEVDGMQVRITPKFSCRAINKRARGACAIDSPVCCSATLGRGT